MKKSAITFKTWIIIIVVLVFSVLQIQEGIRNLLNGEHRLENEKDKPIISIKVSDDLISISF